MLPEASALSLLDLTEKQMIVLNLLSKGLTNKEIGNQMYITENSVKSHITSLNKLLNTKSRLQLLNWYYANSYKIDIVPVHSESNDLTHVPEKKAIIPCDIMLPKQQDT